jgi:hypothetical protein
MNDRASAFFKKRKTLRRACEWGRPLFLSLVLCLLLVALQIVHAGIEERWHDPVSYRNRVDHHKNQIQMPLPVRVDPTVTMMMVEEKPNITYANVGGYKQQIEGIREVFKLPMLHPEKFVKL